MEFRLTKIEVFKEEVWKETEYQHLIEGDKVRLYNEDNQLMLGKYGETEFTLKEKGFMSDEFLVMRVEDFSKNSNKSEVLSKGDGLSEEKQCLE